jgi:hypothetical protein
MRAIQKEPTFFIHWQDSDGRVQQQADFLLYDGQLPSALWTPGSVMRETRTLRVPALSLGNTYGLVVGIYNAYDSARLSLRDDRSGENVLVLHEWRKD